MAARPNDGDKDGSKFSGAAHKARQRGDDLLKMPAPDHNTQVGPIPFMTKLTAAKEDVRKREEDVAALEKQIKENMELVKTREAKAAELEASLEPRAKVVKQKEEEVERNKADIARRQAKFNANEQNIIKRETDVKEKLVDYKKNKEEYERQLEKVNNREQDLEQRENELASAKHELFKIKDELSKIQDELKISQKELDGVKAELQAKVAHLKQLQKSLTELESKKDEITHSQDENARRAKELDHRDKELQVREQRSREKRQPSPVKQPHYIDADVRLHNAEQELDRKEAELVKAKKDKDAMEARALAAEKKYQDAKADTLPQEACGELAKVKEDLKSAESRAQKAEDHIYWLSIDKKDLQEQLTTTKGKEAKTARDLQASEARLVAIKDALVAIKDALVQSEKREQAAATHRDNLQAKIDKVDALIAEAQKEGQKQAQEQEELKTQLVTAKENEKAAIEKLQDLEEQTNQPKGDREAAAEKLRHLQDENEKLGNELLNSEVAITKNEQEIADLKGQLEKQANSLNGLETQLARAKKNEDATVRRYRDLELEHGKLGKNLSDFDAAFARKDLEAQSLRAELRERNSHLDGLQRALSNAQETLGRKQREVESLEKEAYSYTSVARKRDLRIEDLLSALETSKQDNIDNAELKQQVKDQDSLLRERDNLIKSLGGTVERQKRSILRLNEIIEKSAQENMDTKELRQQVKDQDSLMHERDELIKSLQDTLEQHKRSVLGLNQDIEEYKRTITHQAKTVDQLERTDDERIQDIRTLEAALKDMRSNNANSSQAVKKLQDANNKHQLEVQFMKRQFEVDIIAKETKCQAREASLNAEIQSRDKAIRDLVRKGRAEEQTTQAARNGYYKAVLFCIGLEVLTIFVDITYDRHGLPRFPELVYVRMFVLGVAALSALMAASDMGGQK